MGREKASININIWGDSDFRQLTGPAQALYFKLMSHPKLDYCGVVEFHPGRLAALTLEQTADDIVIAAQELSDSYWCVFDQSTDEVMVRGFLRHDGVLLQPRLAVSCAMAYSAVASNKIRAVIVHEILRFKRENPDLAAWTKPQMMTLLKQDSVDVRQTVTDLVWSPLAGLRLPSHAQADDHRDDRPHDHPNGERYGQRLGQTSPNATTAPTTATATSTATATTSDEVAASKSSSSPQPLGDAHPARASSRSVRSS